MGPYPTVGAANLGLWGLTSRRLEYPPVPHAYPPPYLDADWGPWAKWRRVYAEAKRLRGERWMEFVAAFAPALWAYLEGSLGLDTAARRAMGVFNALTDFA